MDKLMTQPVETLADLQKEAWLIGEEGDRARIMEWSSRSWLHSQIMSGRVKFGPNPKDDASGEA